MPPKLEKRKTVEVCHGDKVICSFNCGGKLRPDLLCARCLIRFDCYSTTMADILRLSAMRVQRKLKCKRKDIDSEVCVKYLFGGELEYEVYKYGGEKAIRFKE